VSELISDQFFSILIAGLLVGIVVGLTGMGGGALMTPALIFLGVGHTTAIVTADLTAAAIYKSGGAITHWRQGSPNVRLAAYLIAGSVPMAFLGPWLINGLIDDPTDLENTLKMCIGFALLFKAGFHPYGEDKDTLEAITVAVIGLVMLFLVPLVWGALRKQNGLPAFGAPTVAELEQTPPRRKL
jgi:uncharacterized membrane protein YfcA